MSQEAVQIAENQYIFTEPAPVEFVVTRDGAIDEEYYREQAKRERAERFHNMASGAISAVSGAFKSVGNAFVDKMAQVAQEYDMERYDQKHGTNFYAQYKEQKARERNAQFASRIGLTAMR